MITTKHRALVALASTVVVLAPSLAAPGLAASAVRLTKTTAAALAKRDALAAASLGGGDSVRITNCHAVRGGAYTCQVELIPAHSSSRCRWTDTIRLVKGKPTVVKYTSAHCSD
jgi:hypothetical protein